MSYGPAECSIATFTVLASEIPRNRKRVTAIGRPLAGVRYRICHPSAQDCDVIKGSIGELMISSPSVGPGYLTYGETPFKSVYPTGDFVQEKDGMLWFVGRKNRNTKRHGVWLSLDRIESILIETGADHCHAFVENDHVSAAIILPQSFDEKAYRVKSLNTLSSLLPHSSIPFLCLLKANMPVLLSGKPDLHNLKSMALAALEQNGVRSQSTWQTVHRIIADCMGQVSGFTPATLDQSFFEGGGSSLQVFALKALLEQKFLKRLELNELYTQCSVESITRIIERSVVSIEKVDLSSSDVELTCYQPGPTQAQMLFLDKALNTANQIVLTINVNCASSVIIAALKEVVQNQHVLRTVYKEYRSPVAQLLPVDDTVHIETVLLESGSAEELAKAECQE